MELNIHIKSTIKLIPTWDGIWKNYPTKQNKIEFKIWFLFMELEFKNR